MPQIARADPLLRIARLALRLAMVGVAVTMIVVVIAVAVLFLFPDGKIAAQLAAAPAQASWWLVIASVLGILTLALCMSFVRQLSRIVATVGEGDPFQPDNADRLQRMGWLALGIQACSIATAPFVVMLSRYIDGLKVQFHFSLSAFALALVLFILARVFRSGAAMRADLEGTV